jgi:hypothetical protein
MTWQAALFAQQPQQMAFMLGSFIGCGTFVYYGLHDMYTKVFAPDYEHASQKKLFWKQHFKPLLAMILVVAGSAVWLALKLFTPFRFITFSIAGIITLFYSFPLLPFQRLQRWKENAYMKLAALSGVWAAVTTIIVLPDAQSFSPISCWLFLLRWTFMIGICLPFEVRDAAYDKILMGKTLPDILGIRGLKLVLLASNICYWALLSFIFFQELITVQVFFLAIVHVWIVYFLLQKAITKPQPPATYLRLDVQIILQPIIVGAGAWLA